jgi:hypothetical protein
MLLDNVSTRRPAQLPPHRPQKRLCGDAPSPDAVVVPSRWPPGRHHVSLCRRPAACHQRRGRRIARIRRAPGSASLRCASRSSGASMPTLVAFSPEAPRAMPRSDHARGPESGGTASAGRSCRARRADPSLGGAHANAWYVLDVVELPQTRSMFGLVLELRRASRSTAMTGMTTAAGRIQRRGRAKPQHDERVAQARPGPGDP